MTQALAPGAGRGDAGALTWVRRHSERVDPLLVSALAHVAGVALLLLLSPLAARSHAEVIEIAIVHDPAPPPLTPVRRPPAPIERPPVEPEPTPDDPPPAAPERVPERVRQRVVKQPRPFHPRAAELNAQPRQVAPADARPSYEVPADAPLFELDMEATVDGGPGIAVPVAPEGGGHVRADPGQGGKRGVTGQAPERTRPPNIELAESWEIDTLPEPLNDGDFEPDYPSDAKATGSEALVTVALDIDQQGRVVRARVKQSKGPGFDRAALRYCRRLRFRPALSRGRPLASRIEWEVWFRYRNE